VKCGGGDSSLGLLGEMVRCGIVAVRASRILEAEATSLEVR